jgi:hypothetical protein
VEIEALKLIYQYHGVLMLNSVELSKQLCITECKRKKRNCLLLKHCESDTPMNRAGYLMSLNLTNIFWSL